MFCKANERTAPRTAPFRTSAYTASDRNLPRTQTKRTTPPAPTVGSVVNRTILHIHKNATMQILLFAPLQNHPKHHLLAVLATTQTPHIYVERQPIRIPPFFLPPHTIPKPGIRLRRTHRTHRHESVVRRAPQRRPPPPRTSPKFTGSRRARRVGDRDLLTARRVKRKRRPLRRRFGATHDCGPATTTRETTISSELCAFQC